MKKHIHFTILAFAVFVFIVIFTGRFPKTRAFGIHPEGGHSLITPAAAMTEHQTECTSLATCYPAPLPSWAAVSGVWNSTLVAGQTFDLNPDLGPPPAPVPIYYIPPGVLSKTPSALTTGQCSLGLYTGPINQPVGTCSCTYEYACPPSVCTGFDTKTVNDDIATITLWGTSSSFCPS